MSVPETPLLKPTLYARDRDATPVLLGGRCECGHLFFPMQTFGCERCGRSGSALQEIELKARGRLRSAATVHVHADAARPAPFIIGTIALEDGPIIRTLLIDAPPDCDAPGTEVEGVFIAISSADNASDAFDLRFRPVRS